MITPKTHGPWIGHFGADRPYEVHLQFLPVVTLHNPYSVPLMFEGMRVGFKNLPVGFNFVIDGQDLRPAGRLEPNVSSASIRTDTTQQGLRHQSRGLRQRQSRPPSPWNPARPNCSACPGSAGLDLGQRGRGEWRQPVRLAEQLDGQLHHGPQDDDPISRGRRVLHRLGQSEAATDSPRARRWARGPACAVWSPTTRWRSNSAPMRRRPGRASFSVEIDLIKSGQRGQGGWDRGQVWHPATPE